jgi:predicted ATPase
MGHRDFRGNDGSALGRFDDAWRCIDEALTAVETTKEGGARLIALQEKSRLCRSPTRPKQRSISNAHSQSQANSILRAGMSMARLWRDQGKRDEARDLLAPVYGWFTEGFDTLDLKEAAL